MISFIRPEKEYIETDFAEMSIIFIVDHAIPPQNNNISVPDITPMSWHIFGIANIPAPKAVASKVKVEPLSDPNPIGENHLSLNVFSE